MKNIRKYILLVAGVAMLTSCSVSGPLMVTNNTIGPKRGVAQKKVILGITFGHADLGIAAAAREGGITKIATVDWKVEGGFFTKTYSTIVTGE